MKHFVLLLLCLATSSLALGETNNRPGYQWWLQPSLGTSNHGFAVGYKFRAITDDKIYAIEVEESGNIFGADGSRHVSLTTGKLWGEGLVQYTTEFGIAYVEITEDPNELRLFSFWPGASRQRQPLIEKSGFGVPLTVGAYINGRYIGIGLSATTILSSEGVITGLTIDIPFGKLRY